MYALKKNHDAINSKFEDMPIIEPDQKKEFSKSSPKMENDELNDNISEITDFDIEHTSREQPPEETFDTTVYEYNGKKYIVDNEKFLQRTFDTLEPAEKYTINMCIYKCVRNGYCPYLMYLVSYDSVLNEYLLPSSTITISKEEEQEQQIEEHFKESLFNIFPPNKPVVSGTEAADIYNESYYKGFFAHKNKIELTMVYDATEINIPLGSKKYCWVTTYEIFSLQQLKSTPISKKIESIFDEITDQQKQVHNGKGRWDFYHLKENNAYVRTPYVLFMCAFKKPEGSGFLLFDMFSSNAESYQTIEQTLPDSVSIVYPRVSHPKIGNYTFFTTYPLKKTGLVKRFAVFVDSAELNPLYLIPSENTKLDDLYQENRDTYTAITFKENGTQFWCVKSPEYFSEIDDCRLPGLENLFV